MTQYADLAVDQLMHSDKNPRTVAADTHGVPELADSIRAHGVIEPLVVRPYMGRYVILAGHRRHVAAELAGLKKVPCVVRSDDAPRSVIHLVENMQRVDLTPAETAIAIYAVLTKKVLKAKELAKQIGRSETYVSKCRAVGRWLEKPSLSAAVIAKEDPDLANWTLDDLYWHATAEDRAEAARAQAELDAANRAQARLAAAKVAATTPTPEPGVVDDRQTGIVYEQPAAAEPPADKVRHWWNTSGLHVLQAAAEFLPESNWSQLSLKHNEAQAAVYRAEIELKKWSDELNERNAERSKAESALRATILTVWDRDELAAALDAYKAR